MVKIQPLLSLLLLTTTLCAQQQRRDSLENKITTYLTEDSIRVDLLNQMATETINTNPQKGLNYATMAYELGQKINYLPGFARGLNLAGSSYLIVDDYKVALDYYLKSLAIYESLADYKGISISYNNIGELYEKKNQLTEALSYHKKSLALKEQFLSHLRPIMSHVNMGELYLRLNKLDSALLHYRKAESLAVPAQRPKALAKSLTGLGKVYAGIMAYDRANNYYDRADSIWQALHDYVGLADNALEKANIAFAQKDYDRSNELTDEAIRQARMVTASAIEMKALQLKCKIDSTTADYLSAFEHMKAYDQLKSKVFDLAKERQLQTIQSKFEFEESERMRRELLKEKQTNKDIVKYQWAIIANIGFILFLISVITVIFYKQAKKQTRLNRLLKMKNKEIREKALELEILNNNLEDMVDERTSVIQKKNVKLKEYSFLNAHIVRGPLANILGLTKLLQKPMPKEDQNKMLGYLKNSADKLDNVLTDIKKRLEKGEMIN